jgi:hypothetical protein
MKRAVVIIGLALAVLAGAITFISTSPVTYAGPILPMLAETGESLPFNIETKIMQTRRGATMADGEPTVEGAIIKDTQPERLGGPGLVASLVSLVQVVSIVVGVVISVLSFNATRQKEAEVRATEAAKPFLELRQSTYIDALQVAGILANPDTHTKEELTDAKKRFRDLYVARLSMVEAPEVESSMVALASLVDPELTKLNPAQSAALQLAHALRDTFVSSYRLSR